MRIKNGSSLSLGWSMCRSLKSSIFLTFFNSYFNRHILYFFIQHIYFIQVILNIYNSDKFSDYMHLQTSAFKVIWALNISLFLMVSAFAGWNWYLAINGYTTIEFWDRGRGVTFEKPTTL